MLNLDVQEAYQKLLESELLESPPKKYYRPKAHDKNYKKTDFWDNKKSLPKKKADKFYNFLKSKNQLIEFFHGTSDKNYMEMKKTGYIAPGSVKSDERGGSFNPNKVYMTRNSYVAREYAGRISGRQDGAKPVILKLKVPLHKIDEVASAIYGRASEGMGEHYGSIQKAVYESKTMEEAYQRILKTVKSKSLKEFTIQYAYPLERVTGARLIKPLDEDDILDFIENELEEYEQASGLRLAIGMFKNIDKKKANKIIDKLMPKIEYYTKEVADEGVLRELKGVLGDDNKLYKKLLNSSIPTIMVYIKDYPETILDYLDLINDKSVRMDMLNSVFEPIIKRLNDGKHVSGDVIALYKDDNAKYKKILDIQFKNENLQGLLQYGKIDKLLELYSDDVSKVKILKNKAMDEILSLPKNKNFDEYIPTIYVSGFLEDNAEYIKDRFLEKYTKVNSDNEIEVDNAITLLDDVFFLGDVADELKRRKGGSNTKDYDNSNDETFDDLFGNLF